MDYETHKELYESHPFLWYVDVKDERKALILSERVKQIDEYGANAHIYENKAGNFDLIISSKISTKQRGRENLTEKTLFDYLNVICDAFKMANE